MANVKTDLTRAEMEAIIRGGGSIHHGGKLITKIAELPDDVDLAQSNDDLEAAAEQLEREELELEQRRRKLSQRFRERENSELAPTSQERPSAFAGSPLPAEFVARDKLTEAGFDTLEKVEAATDEQLLAIRFVGDATVKDIRADASKLRASLK
jgi:hypothetical protein